MIASAKKRVRVAEDEDRALELEAAEDALERRALQQSRASTGPRSRRPEKMDAAALARASASIAPKMAWIESLVLTAPAPLECPSVDDDLEREVAFYNMTLEMVTRSRVELTKVGEKFKRPDDYFCEMVKSDTHMAKVKDELIFQQQKMEAFEKRKERQQSLKFTKAVQETAKQAKAASKREGHLEVKEWRADAAKKRNRNGVLDDDGDEGPAPKKRPFKKTSKQLNKDQKWGMGGIKKGQKRNDKKSIGDLSTFNPTRGKTGAKGKGAGGGGGKKGRR